MFNVSQHTENITTPIWIPKKKHEKKHEEKQKESRNNNRNIQHPTVELF